MKKILLWIVLSPVIAFACLISGQVASAHSWHHHPTPTPAPMPLPPITPPVTSSIPWGAFNGSTRPLGAYQAFFIGDGDSFTADAQGFTEPLVVYWESNYSASKIAAGGSDNYLKKWATQMKSYGKPVIFVILDEMNLTGEYPYAGNPTAFKAAFNHVASLFSGVQLAYDPNVAFSGNTVSNLAAYYPSSATLCALDGFSFGNPDQSFSQVFSASIAEMKTVCGIKPLWILSTGTTGNQEAWISAAFNSGVQGVIFFSYQQFSLTSTAQTTLKSL